ncbi:hypothetical protein GW17_00001081 [Ensete ventricosum]|nr:hypothetical protein GW17_00001081 [Ensete ventricosum]
MVRETLQDMKLRDIHIPKGITISTPIASLHHDPEYWGSDTDEFKPNRFSRGIAGACRSPHAYIPFGSGTRTCAGQNFAMVELKVILSLLLSKFVFSVSPSYRHSPAFRLTIEPEFGVPLIGAESFGLYETIRGEGEDNDDKMEEAAAVGIHDRGSHVGEPTVRHVVSESDTRYTITYFDRRRPIDGEIDRWRSIEEEKGKKKKRKRRKQKKRRSTSHRPRLRALATRWSPASRCRHRHPRGTFVPAQRDVSSPRAARETKATLKSMRSENLNVPSFVELWLASFGPLYHVFSITMVCSDNINATHLLYGIQNDLQREAPGPSNSESTISIIT